MSFFFFLFPLHLPGFLQWECGGFFSNKKEKFALYAIFSDVEVIKLVWGVNH